MTRIVDCARQNVPVDAAAVDRLAAALRAHHSTRDSWRSWQQVSPAVAFVLMLLSFFAGVLVTRSVRGLAPEPGAAATPVTFVLVAESARQVALVGDFNDWTPGRTRLIRREGGVWSVVVPLDPGRYSYAFVLDGGEWVGDPGAPPSVDEDFGRPSSVLIVERRTL